MPLSPTHCSFKSLKYKSKRQGQRRKNGWEERKGESCRAPAASAATLILHYGLGAMKKLPWRGYRHHRAAMRWRENINMLHSPESLFTRVKKIRTATSHLPMNTSCNKSYLSVNTAPLPFIAVSGKVLCKNKPVFHLKSESDAATQSSILPPISKTLQICSICYSQSCRCWSLVGNLLHA